MFSPGGGDGEEEVIHLADDSFSPSHEILLVYLRHAAIEPLKRDRMDYLKVKRDSL